MCHTKVVPRPQNRGHTPKGPDRKGAPTMKNQTFGIEIETTGR